MWKEVQAALNKKGDNIQINFRPVNPTSYDSVLQTAMNGGQGPDILYTRAGEGTQSYAAANMIKPLNGLVNFSTINNNAALAAAQYQGKTYAVPFAIQTMSVFYNKQIFAKYNLQVPKTWAQFLQLCQTLKSHGVTPLYNMGIQGWMLALQFDEIGASFMSDSFTQGLVNKTAKYTDAPYVNALKAYQQLAPYFEPNFQAVGSAGNEQETDFALGKSAMVMDGIFDVPTIQKDNPNLQLGEFLIPASNAGTTPKIDWYVDGNIAMNNNIKNTAVEKAAEEIIKYTTTKQFGQDFSNIAGEISPISGVQIPSKYPLSIQAYKWFQNNAVQPIFDIRSPMDTPPPTPVNSKSKSVNNDKGVFSEEQAVMLPLLTHKITPQKAAKTIQDALSWYYK